MDNVDTEPYMADYVEPAYGGGNSLGYLRAMRKDIQLTFSHWVDADFDVPVTDQVEAIFLKVWDRIPPYTKQIFRMERTPDGVDFALARVMDVAACVFDADGQPRVDKEGEPIDIRIIRDCFLGMQRQHENDITHRIYSTMRLNTLKELSGGPSYKAVVSELIKIFQYQENYFPISA